MRTAGLVLLSLAVGALSATLAIRQSRNPDSFLFALRSKAGMAPRNTSEADWLTRQYGPERHSQDLEEWIVRDFFKDKKQGVFVDVGAAHYKDGSNTFFLENNLGWSGLAIDAQQRYAEGYAQHRPHTRFFTVFVDDHSNDKVRLFLSSSSSFVASKEKAFTEQFGSLSGATDVTTITLNDLLGAQNIAHFDFLTMDIELAEPAALAGFDIQRFRPALAAVEAHPEVRQQILDYFNANRYIPVGKYLRVDPANLWFMPVGSSVRPFPAGHNTEEWLK